MKRKWTKYIIFSMSFMAQMSCGFQFEEPLELPESKPELAVLAEINNEDGFSAYVVKKRNFNEAVIWDFNIGDSVIDIKTGKTVLKTDIGFSSLFSVLYDFIPSVKVSIFEEGKFLTNLTAEYRPLPLYTNFDYKLQKGKKYQIEVSAPGFPTVTGEQIAISDIKPDEIEFRKDGYQSPDNVRLSELIVRFKDPVSEQNSYLLSVVVQKTDRKTSKTTFEKVPLVKIDPTASTVNIMSDRLFDGQAFEWRLAADVQRVLADTEDKNVNLIVSFFPINSDLEKFYRTIGAKDDNFTNFFGEPVAPYSNLKGGLGVFSISGVATTKSFIIK